MRIRPYQATRRIVAPAALLAVALGLAAQDPAPATPKANPDDVKSVDAIVAALYDVISGDAGEERDWERFRSLFAPGARLIPAVATPEGGSRARVLTPEDFAKLAGDATKKQGFHESEIARHTEAFGNIAHVWSTYESRRAKDQPPFSRGINSIHLMKDGDRWHVVTIYWDSERPDNPIPKEFLPKE